MAVLWMFVTALLAQGQVQSAKSLIPKITADVLAGDSASAHRLADQLHAKAHRAHLLTTGPVWALASHLPVLGDPVVATRGGTSALDAISTRVLTPVLDITDEISPAQLRTSGTHIDIAALARAVPLLESPMAASHEIRARVDRLPAHTWLAISDAAVAQLQTQTRHLDGLITVSYRAAQIIPPFLGRDGPRRYFIALQNEAEMRGTGGLPGTLGVLRADHGTVAFEKFRSDSYLNGVPSSVTMAKDYAQMFGSADPTEIFVNGNVSPDFPTAAKIWMSMWKKKTGETLDGAIAVDPTAMADFLETYQPTRLADGELVSSDNLVALTQRDVYFRYPAASQTDLRKQFLVAVATAVSHTLLSARANPQQIALSASKAAGERRLLIYSTDPKVEGFLANTSLSGIVDQSHAGLTGLVINNAGGNKLDFYLTRSVEWTCSRGRATVLVSLRNDAPATLTPYVAARLDRHSGSTRLGSNILWVDWVDMADGVLLSSSVDNDLGFAQIGSLNGHPVYRFVLEIQRGETRTIILRLQEPRNVRAERLTQPGVVPLVHQQRNASCN